MELVDAEIDGNGEAAFPLEDSWVIGLGLSLPGISIYKGSAFVCDVVPTPTPAYLADPQSTYALVDHAIALGRPAGTALVSAIAAANRVCTTSEAAMLRFSASIAHIE